jgi:DNA-binding LacI/PurR family transcriptional regulator
MGESAARLLLDVLDGKTEHQAIELETEIVIRESLGQVNSQA